MRPNTEVASLARDLAAQDWIWERQPVESTLSSLGWRKRDSVGHRDTYTCLGRPNASVYHDGDRPELVEVVVEAFTDVGLLDDLGYEDTVDEFYRLYWQLSG